MRKIPISIWLFSKLMCHSSHLRLVSRQFFISKIIDISLPPKFSLRTHSSTYKFSCFHGRCHFTRRPWHQNSRSLKNPNIWRYNLMCILQSLAQLIVDTKHRFFNCIPIIMKHIWLYCFSWMTTRTNRFLLTRVFCLWQNH